MLTAFDPTNERNAELYWLGIDRTVGFLPGCETYEPILKSPLPVRLSSRASR
jgi:hypothetical protein